MNRERILWVASWLIPGLVLTGEIFFGGVQPVFRNLFLGAVLVVGGAAIFLQPEERQIERKWFWFLLPFPVWLIVQLIPLPSGFLGLINPNRVDWARRFWPGPARGIEDDVLLGSLPDWLPWSIDSTAGREFLFLVLAGVLVFLAARALLGDNPELRKKLLWLVALFTTAEALYGLGQWTAGSPKVLWFEKTAYLDCATGTLINRNHFAMLLYLGMGCALSLMHHHHRHRGPWSSHDAGKDTARRITLALAVAIQFAGILASKSRAGLAGGLLVLVVALPTLLRHRRWVTWVTLGLAILMIIPVAIFVGADLAQRLSALPAEWTGEQSRGEVLRLAPGMIRDFPLGTGGGTFEYSFQQYRPLGIKARYDFAHNDYLQVLLETGPPGLILALAPVAFFAFTALFRSRELKEDREGTGIPLPLLGGLGAVACHEWVDFGLLIPANTLMVALLAGAFSASCVSPPIHRRWTRGLAILAFLVAVPAALHSVGRWEFLGSSSNLMPLPDTAHRQASQTFRAWRKTPGQLPLLREALAKESTAQRLRPLEPIYSIQFALQSLSGAENLEDRKRDGDPLREQASRAAARARAIDPMNAYNRKRTMELGLSLGELDLAFQDARIVMENNTLIRETIETLLKAGVPAPLVADQAASNPLALRTLLWLMIQDEDWETLGVIIPAEVVPTPRLCFSSSQIRLILKNSHARGAESFLTGCLTLPEVQNEKNLTAEIRASLAWDYFGERKIDQAEAMMRKIPPGLTRIWVEMEILRAQENWEELQKAALGFIGHPALRDNPTGEARLRFRLAEAFCRTGQVGKALTQMEKATQLDPAYELAHQALWKLQRGENPFPSPTSRQNPPR